MPLPDLSQLEASLTVVVFGMGLGESILVRVGDEEGHRWAVIDSARRIHDGRGVNPALKTLVASDAYPELVVLTHPHRDHSKGMAEIVRRAAPGAVVTCIEELMEPSDYLDAVADADDRKAIDVGQATLAHAAIHDAWRSRKARRWPLHEGADPLVLGSWSLRIIHPSQLQVEAAVSQIRDGGEPNLNNVSAALLLERPPVQVLLAADGEYEAWESVQERLAPMHFRSIRPVKVPHHGSLGAIHPLITDASRPSVDREQIVTPFSQSGCLPRFEPDQGVEELLAAAGVLHLTAMPYDLIPSALPVSIDEARAATQPVAFAGDEDLQVRRNRPPSHASLTSGRRDPHECWVLLAIDLDGDVAVTHGAHAVHLTNAA